MKLSIAIVNWNVSDLLEKCLSSIFKYPPNADFETIVVDNASSDNSVEMVRNRFPKVRLLENKKNMGFSAGNNRAVQESSGEFILILNPDTEITKGSLDDLINFLETHPEAGIVAPKIINPDGSLQKSCMGFPTLGAMAMRQLFLELLWPGNPFTRTYLMSDFKYDRIREVDQPMGACLLVRRELFDEVGLFDEKSFMFFDEVDLCYRAKVHGWLIFFTPQPRIIHHGGSSIKKWGVFNLGRHWTRSRNHYFGKYYGKSAVTALNLLDFLKMMIVIILLLCLAVLLNLLIFKLKRG